MAVEPVLEPPRGYCLVLDEALRRYIQTSLYLNRVYDDALEVLKGRVVYAIGDMVSRTLLSVGVRPRVVVYDCFSERRRIGCPEPPPGYVTVVVRNPRGMISWESFEAARLARGCKCRLFIHVIGEEDLVAIPFMLYAPEDAIVVYGVPGRGVSLVEASWGRILAHEIASLMRLEPCHEPEPVYTEIEETE